MKEQNREIRKMGSGTDRQAEQAREWERLLQQAQAGDVAWQNEQTGIKAEQNAQWQEHCRQSSSGMAGRIS